MNTKPHFDILTWCDYATVWNQQLTIVGTFSYISNIQENIFSKFFVMKGWVNKSSPHLDLLIAVRDLEGIEVFVAKVDLHPSESPTERWVFQLCLPVTFPIENKDYELSIAWDDGSTPIETLPLPVRLGETS